MGIQYRKQSPKQFEIQPQIRGYMAKLTVEARNVRLDALTALLGLGAKTRVFTASYAVLLAEFVWSGPIALPANQGILTLNDPDNTVVHSLGDGTATIAQIVKADDTLVVTDLTVGTTTSFNIKMRSVLLGVDDRVTWVLGALAEGNA